MRKIGEKEKIMIEMKSASRELTKVERYRLTLSPEIQTVQDLADDTVIHVSAFAEFDDINEESGEVAHLLGILDKDGKSYVTQSVTFKRSFSDIADIFADDGESEFSIRKISGTTKANRPYVNCVLA